MHQYLTILNLAERTKITNCYFIYFIYLYKQSVQVYYLSAIKLKYICTFHIYYYIRYKITYICIFMYAIYYDVSEHLSFTTIIPPVSQSFIDLLWFAIWTAFYSLPPDIHTTIIYIYIYCGGVR